MLLQKAHPHKQSHTVQNCLKIVMSLLPKNLNQPKSLNQLEDNTPLKCSKAADTLERLRDEIDAIDTQLCTFLNHRMELSRRVGALKNKNKNTNPQNSTPILHPQREREIIEAAVARISLAPACASAIIYREIMCVGITAYQRPLSLSCSCYADSQHDDTANSPNRDKTTALSRIVRNHFGITAKETWFKTPEDALEAVQSGAHIAAILPWVDRGNWWQSLANSSLAIVAHLPMFLWPCEPRSNVDLGDEFALVSAANSALLSHPKLASHLILAQCPDDKMPSSLKGLNRDYIEIKAAHFKSIKPNEAQNQLRLFCGTGPAPLADQSLEKTGLQVIGAWPEQLDLCASPLVLEPEARSESEFNLES